MSPPRHYRIFHESRNRSLFCAVVSSWPQTNAEESWFLKLPYLGFRGSSPQTVVLTFSSHDSPCPALSHMLWECRETGSWSRPADGAEKGLQPLSAGSAETTSGWQSSNAAVLFGITRRDGYRVDVVYLVFWFLMIVLLYHEGYNLEGGLIQSSFILFIATLYITSYEVISHPLIWCISSFQWDWKLPKAGVPSSLPLYPIKIMLGT